MGCHFHSGLRSVAPVKLFSPPFIGCSSTLLYASHALGNRAKCPCRIDFFCAAASLNASNGDATSVTFLRTLSSSSRTPPISVDINEGLPRIRIRVVGESLLYLVESARFYLLTILFGKTVTLRTAAVTFPVGQNTMTKRGAKHDDKTNPG